jgi:hypothetical protein
MTYSWGQTACRGRPGEDFVDALLVDQAKRCIGDAQAHPAVFALDPEAARLEVGQEAAFGLVIGVRDVVADHRRFPGHLAYTGHHGLLSVPPGAFEPAASRHTTARAHCTLDMNSIWRRRKRLADLLQSP